VCLRQLPAPRPALAWRHCLGMRSGVTSMFCCIIYSRVSHVTLIVRVGRRKCDTLCPKYFASQHVALIYFKTCMITSNGSCVQFCRQDRVCQFDRCHSVTGPEGWTARFHQSIIGYHTSRWNCLLDWCFLFLEELLCLLQAAPSWCGCRHTLLHHSCCCSSKAGQQ
jgi:hypothetical protein